MSGVECNFCGKIRKVEQVFSTDGWHNPPCWNCNAPGWVEAFTEDGGDPTDQPEPWAGSARWPRPFLYADLDDQEGKR